MVADGIAILKVGPALSFAMREALFLLSRIEEDLGGARHGEASRLPRVLEERHAEASRVLAKLLPRQ